MKKVKTTFIMNRGTIFCRVTMPNGSIGSFSTGVKIHKNYFQNGAIISNLDHHQPLIDKLVETYYEVRGLDPYPNETGQMFVDRLKGRSGTHENMVPKTILEAMKYTIDRKTSVTKSRMSAYHNAFKYLYEYLNEVSSIGDMRLREMDAVTFDEWTNWLCDKKGLSLKTSEVYMSAIHGTIDYVAKRFIKYEEVPGYNPISGAGSLTAKQKRSLKKKTLKNYLSEDEVSVLSATMNNPEFSPEGWSYQEEVYLEYVLWQIYTGASFADTFYGEYEILTYDEEEYLTYHRIKTEEECIIPITDDITLTINRLTAQAEWVYKNQRYTRRDKGSEMAEFQSYRRFLSKRIEPLIARKVTSHTLRHTFGMRQINVLGYSADQVQRQMGHSSIQTTMDNYAHLKLEGMARNKPKS